MSQCSENKVITPEIEEKIKSVIAENKNKQGTLIAVLHEVQDILGYVPYEAQKMVAEGLNVPLSDVYGVVTFYSRFTLNPVGKYKVGVCLGTACYVKGSDKILEKIEKKLKLKAGETSEDGLFSIEATRCIGACGLAPVMTINEDVYGKLLPEQVEAILEKYK